MFHWAWINHKYSCFKYMLYSWSANLISQTCKYTREKSPAHRKPATILCLYWKISYIWAFHVDIHKRKITFSLPHHVTYVPLRIYYGILGWPLKLKLLNTHTQSINLCVWQCWAHLYSHQFIHIFNTVFRLMSV